MAAKRKREYGTGSVYQDKAGQWWTAVRINGKLVRRRVASRDAGETTRAELLAQRGAAEHHVSRLDGMTMALELWWQRLPEAERPRYRLLLDARIRPVIESLRELGLETASVEGHAQTVHQWLTEWFRIIKHERNLKPRTIERYGYLLTHYILPALGDLRLYEFTAKEIQRFVTDLRAEIAAEGRYEGIVTVRNAFSVIRDAMAIAVNRGYVGRHPCNGVIVPTGTIKIIDPLTDQQFRLFLAATETVRHPVLWKLYALLGIRRSEGTGLAWPNVDWNERTIRIENQYHYADGEFRLDTPKSAASRRKIPLTPYTYALLRALYDATPPDLRMGTIFLTRNGTPVSPASLYVPFGELAAAAELSEETTPHHLRHTVSTLLDETGASEVVKSAILGHGKKGVSQRYTHARLDAMRRAMVAVEERIFQTHAMQSGT